MTDLIHIRYNFPTGIATPDAESVLSYDVVHTAFMEWVATQNGNVGQPEYESWREGVNKGFELAMKASHSDRQKVLGNAQGEMQ